MKKISIGLIVLCMLASTAFAGIAERTLLSAVTTTGAGSAWNTSDMETKTVYCIATDATTGGTLAVQTSEDGTNWVTIVSEAVVTGLKEISIVGLYHRYIRANLTARTDGTYTVTGIGKQ